jgi:hypothetical protein
MSIRKGGNRASGTERMGDDLLAEYYLMIVLSALPSSRELSQLIGDSETSRLDPYKH